MTVPSWYGFEGGTAPIQTRSNPPRVIEPVRVAATHMPEGQAIENRSTSFYVGGDPPGTCIPARSSLPLRTPNR